MILTKEEYIAALKHVGKIAAKPYCSFLELGCDVGTSSVVLGKICKENSGHLYCVDFWPLKDRKKTFDESMVQNRLTETVHPSVVKSLDYLCVCEDNSFDLVFIDANHEYTFAIEDCKESLRIIKPGGILMIHDVVGTPSDYKKGWLEKNKNSKRIDVKKLFPESSPGFIHPGIVVAVEELFGEVKNRFKELVWFRMGNK